MYLNFRIQRKHMQEGEVGFLHLVFSNLKSSWKLTVFILSLVIQLPGLSIPCYCLIFWRIWGIRLEVIWLRLGIKLWMGLEKIKNMYTVFLCLEYVIILCAQCISFWLPIYFSGICVCTFIWSWGWRSSWRWYPCRPSVSTYQLSLLVLLRFSGFIKCLSVDKNWKDKNWS